MEYQPGELKVVASKGGLEWASDVVTTTAEPTKFLPAADPPEIAADGLGLCFVRAVVTDAEGRTVPRSANLMRFTVEGPGEIIAVADGDAASHEPFQAL